MSQTKINNNNQAAEQAPAEELLQVVRRAEKGDRSVLPRLRQLLDADPSLWRQFGDLALHAEASLVRLAAGTNLLLEESLVRRLAELKAELAGPSASPLERLLAAEVAGCWLQVAYLDAVCAQAKGGRPSEEQLARRQQDQAHRRYLAALKTAALMRKLLRPAPAPVEIATRLQGGSGPGLRRAGVMPEGVGVNN